MDYGVYRSHSPSSILLNRDERRIGGMGPAENMVARPDNSLEKVNSSHDALLAASSGLYCTVKALTLIGHMSNQSVGARIPCFLHHPTRLSADLFHVISETD